MVTACFAGCYAGKRVFVTGHSGFKGSWLSLWLKQLGAKVWGYSLPIVASSSSLREVIDSAVFQKEFAADIRDADELEAALREAEPDIIFHLAAQALVRRSYVDPGATFEVNALGTMRLLETVRHLRLPCPVVVVTSDKCYENHHWVHGYRETDSLGGHDVYSMSKAATELIVRSWRRSFFQVDDRLGPLATVRAGNVIGGGDYAEDRIVPDCVRALQAGRPLGVRNPRATRPWQHVLDCLSGYLCLGARLAQEGKSSHLNDAFNFGPNTRANQPVAALVREFLQHWPGEWQDESDPAALHEADLLHLSTDKAAQELRWFPTWEFSDAVRETARWYHARHAIEDTDMLDFSIQQIESFSADAAKQQIAWALAK